MSVRSRDTFSISFMMRVVLKSGVALKRRRSEKHFFFYGLLYRENLPSLVLYDNFQQEQIQKRQLTAQEDTSAYLLAIN